jgi:hypothetical protein
MTEVEALVAIAGSLRYLKWDMLIIIILLGILACRDYK